MAFSPNVGNRPLILLDANRRQIEQSSRDLAFQADFSGGSNMIYKGLARPGSATSAAVWQIAKLAYDGNNNLISITWPQNASGVASNDYSFIWANRATYTYS